MGIAEIALSGIITAIVDLAVKGAKAFAEAKKAERAKLARLRVPRRETQRGTPQTAVRHQLHHHQNRRTENPRKP